MQKPDNPTTAPERIWAASHTHYPEPQTDVKVTEYVRADVVGRIGWRPIDTAPKSTVENGIVRGVYILAYCPDEGTDPKSCISVVWWEPLMRNGRGQWQGETCDMPMRPTHWMPLPEPPHAE